MAKVDQYNGANYYTLGHVYPRDGLRVPLNRRKHRQLLPTIIAPGPPVGPGKLWEGSIVASRTYQGTTVHTGLLDASTVVIGTLNAIGLKEGAQDGASFLQE